MGTFSSDGYIRERMDAWQTKLKDIYYSIFGDDIDLSDDSQDGQVIGALSEAFANQDQQVELVSKVCNPNEAQASYLSTLVKINGINRNTDETDTALRIRRRDSVAIAATGNVQAVLAALVNVTGVTSAVVKENPDGSPDVDGISGHSIACIVEGGDNQTIAEEIYRTKSAGCGMDGDITINVEDANGFLVPVNFYRPELINIRVAVDIAELSDYPTTGDADVKQAIVNYFTELQEVGDDVILSQMYNPINTVPGVSVTSLKIGTTFVQTLTFSGVLIAGNKINGKVGGVSIAEITFAADHATTMAAIVAAIITASALKVASATVVGNVITVTTDTDEVNQTLSNWVVTAGVSQATTTIATTSLTATSITLNFNQLAHFNVGFIEVTSV